MSSYGDRNILKDISKVRANIVEILLLAILVSFSVNLVSDFFNESLGKNQSSLLALIILVLSMGYVLYSRLYKKPESQKIRAVLSVNDKNEILEVDEYDFNYRFKMIAESLFVENKALKKQWSKDPLGHIRNSKRIDDNAVRHSSSRKLLREITEYIILSSLSTHLTDYFNKKDYDKNLLVNLSRNDVSNLITTNRVLDIISKDMNDRAAFASRIKPSDDKPAEGEVIMAWVKGAVYEKFELVLPKGSSIHREKDESITINSKSIKLNFKVISDGFGRNVDYMFEKYYMGQEKPFNIDHYGVDIIITITVKPSLLAFGRRVKYHMWSESFLARTYDDFDFKAFTKQINWTTIRTMLKVRKHLSPN
jgi:hypothetical protein